MKLVSVYVAIVLTFTASAVFGSESERDSSVSFFEGSFEAALEQAKQDDLPLFMYLTMPNCSPCEFMETKVFPDPEVGDYMNTRFVSFKLNAFDEEVNGPALAKRFSVMSYPTYLIIGHEGKVKHRSTSASNPANFMRMIGWLTGETASPMAEHDAKYAKGDRDPDFVQQYLLDSRMELSLLPKDYENWEANMEAYQKARDKYTAITEDYLASKSSKDLINSRDLSVIRAYCNEPEDAGVELLMDNFDAFVEVSSLQEVSSLLLEVYSYAALTKALEGDPSYIEVLEFFDEEPLKRATDYKRRVDPESGQLPENQRDHLAEVYSSTIDEQSSDPEQ